MSESAGAAVNARLIGGGRTSRRRRRSVTWTRDWTSIPLLIALVLSTLVVVAAPQPVAAQVGGPLFFTADFDDPSDGGAGFGSFLEDRTGGASVGGGVVNMPSSNNNVVRTNDNNYETASFCAQITVVNYIGGGDNRAYLGFGPGNIIGTDGDFPREGPAVVLRSVGSWGGGSSIDNLTLLTAPDVGVAGSEILNAGGQGLGTGGYTLQLEYDAVTPEVRASVDGVQFGPTVDVSSYDFTNNGKLFFAGQGVTFDNFSLQPGSCSTTDGSFVEDFSGGSLPSSFEIVGNSPDPVFGSDVARFVGSSNEVGNQRSYLRTVATDYATVDFRAEVTVTIPSGQSGNAIGFFGLGPVVPLNMFGEPGDSYKININPTNFFPRVDAPGASDTDCGGDGTHRVRLEWVAATQTGQFSVDNDYVGGDLAPDCILPAFASPTLVFDDTNSQLFIGGDYNIVFDDVVAIVEPTLTAPVMVTDIGDAPDAVPSDGVCDTGAGTCTLRAAIQTSNARPGADTVGFDIAGAAPHTISPLTALPPITETITIDGFTQPGSSPTNSAVVTINAVPGVRVVGPGPGSGLSGLDLSASTDSTVRGLSILSFATGIVAGSGTTIAGNYIGADATGNFGHIDGIFIDGANNVVVGGTNPADRNLISGNGGGIVIEGDADDNSVLGNLIGTDAGGTTSIGNGVGILFRSSGGGDTATATGNQIGNGFLNGRNTIAGNNGEGISIGTNSTGTSILANWVGVGFGTVGALLGNNQSGTDTDSGNWGGIAIRGGTNTVIGGLGGQGNLIANNNNGVVVLSGTANRIGGANVIRDNLDRGIVVAGAGVNDPGDVDEGANRGQNQPVLSGARIDGGNAVVDFSIDTADLGAYPITVEVFEADSGASGEGARFIRRDTTTATGPGSYSIVLGSAGGLSIADGDQLVATATDAAGNTSSFSNVAVVGGSDALVSATPGERFGQAVALDGNRMAVSAPLADVGAINAGAVYVYDRTDLASPWVLTGVIASPTPELDGSFGDALDLRGDRIAIGESDRLRAIPEQEGRVWVFELSGDAWSQRGGWIEAEGPGDGNQFGASISWIDDNRLAIGAPGAVNATGEVWAASYSGGEGGSWTAFELPTFNSGATQAADDQLGYDVAFDDSPAGDGRLVAGAPGASRRYSWDVPAAGPIGNPGVAQFTAAWNMGTAVDISGDRVVTAGYSDQLRVDVNEASPVQRSNTTELGANAPSGAGEAPVNDYLDIEGTQVAVGRGASGGQVEIYRIDPSNLLLVDPLPYAPPVAPGDRLGWALGFDGTTLVAGAPGTSASAGAVFSTGIAPRGPCTTTWTGAVDGIFTNPGNWTVGVPDGADVACLDGVAAETITIPSGQSVDVLRFESAGQSLVIDGSLTVNEFSTLDGDITVNGSLNGVGDIVIADFAEVSGTITGLVTVANGAQLFFLDGTIAGPSTVLTNLGDVVVAGPGLLLDNGVTVDNGGLWEFFTGDTSGDGNVDQTVLLSVPDSSTFNNGGVVRKVGDGLTVLQGGFDFNMGDGSAIVVAEGELRLFADGTWTGDELGIDVQSEPATTFVWAGNQTLSGGISGTSSVDAVGKVVISGTKTWTVPGGAEPRANALDFGHDPTAPASENYQFDLAAVTFLGEPFDIDGFARFIGGTSNFDTDAAVNADIAVTQLSRVTIDNEVTVTIRGDVELDGSIRTEEFFDDGTSFFDGGVLVFDAGSGPIDVSGTGTVDNRGEVRTLGTTTTTVGADVTWQSSSSGSLLIDEGELVLSGPVVYLDDEPGLLGFTFIGAGALLTVAGDLPLTSDSFVEIEISGPSTDTSKFGRVDVGGVLTKGGGLFAVGLGGGVGDYEPTIDDAFPVITCTDCYPGSFDFFGTGPLDAVPTATAITLQIVANKISQPDDSSGYRFGSDIDIDGNWAVVSAPAASGDDGGLFVYELVAGEWTLDQVLFDFDNPGLGASVALDGNHLAATTDGPVRIWSRTAPGLNFTPLGAGALPAGTSVSIDGNTLIVGNSADAVPEARVYDLVSGGSLLATLIPDGSTPVTTFGDAVAVFDGPSGDGYAAIGARSNSGAGAVYTFKRSSGVWNLTPDEILISPDGGAFPDNIAEQPRGQFGNAVAIDGETLVVAEFLNSATLGRGDAGAAWVYSGVPDAFSAPVRIVASDGGTGDVFGTAVDVDGDVIIVGAGASQETNVPYRAGAAYVFDRTGASWTEREVLRAADRFDGERFGDAVAVSGANALVGAPFDINGFGFGGGAAYSYDVTPPAPTVPTFVGIGMSSWTNPASWSTGVVPGAGDEAVVPLGAMAFVDGADAVDIGSLTVAGELFVFGGLSILDSSTISATGILWVENGAGTTIDGAALDVVAGGQLTIRSAALVELSDGASIAGDGLVANSGTVTTAGRVAIGSGLTWNSGLSSLLEVRSGVLDIQPASFGYDGEIFVAAGAVVEVQGTVTLVESSVLTIGITGDDSAPSNYGQIVLASSDLNADGTLRTQVFGYDATFDDQYPVITCVTGDCLVGAFDTLDITPFVTSRTATGLALQGPAVPVGLDFDFTLAPGAPSSLAVAPTGVAVDTLDRTSIARSGGGAANVAASSITSIGTEDDSLASLTLDQTPLSDAILASDVLSTIPLVNVDIEGGWSRIIALSPELRKEPLSSLTLGQVLRDGDAIDTDTPAGVLAATPLRAVDVQGTPLRAVPLAAIALGAIPLRAVPLRAVAPGEPEPSWCDLLGPALLAEYGNDCGAALELSLFEATIRGAAIDATPLRAVPLRAVAPDEGSTLAPSPLRAVLVENVALGSTPIGAIPLRAVPLRAVPLRAVPLRAVGADSLPVSAVLDASPTSGPQSTPLRAVELNASPLRAVNTSITLEAAPLRAVDVNGTPVSAIQVQGAPLRAVPISAVMLADLPLDQIALEEGGETFDWCEVLASIDAGFDCTSGVDPATTTLNDLSIRSVPLRAVPLRAVPLRAVLASTSVGSIPLRAVPLRAVPLRAVPLGGISLADTAVGAIDITGTPLRAVPLRAVDITGTALSNVPLRAVAVDAIPLRAVPLRAVPLRAVPLRAVPLRAVPLRAVALADIPLRAVDVFASPLRAVPLRAVNPALVDCVLADCARGTLADALLSGAISGDVTLEQIQDALGGVSLADLVAALPGIDTAEMLDALGLLTLENLTSLDNLTLGDLPRGIAELDAVTLGVLLDGLPVGTFADLAEAVLDPATGRPVQGLEARLLDAIASLNLSLGDLERLGDVTLEDILAGTHPITLADIEPILRFVTIDTLQRVLDVTIPLGDLTLGDLTPQQLGQLTLADLSQLEGYDGLLDIGAILDELRDGGQLDGFTLSDLLLAFVDPGSLAYGGVVFADVDVRALPEGTVGSTSFEASFTLTASAERTVELELQLPRTAGYIVGSSQISGAGAPASTIDATRVGDLLTWSFVATPGVAYSITFDVLPTLSLGSTSLSGAARIVGTDISIPATAGVTVVEGTEPNDFRTIAETTPAAEDVVYLTYIAESDDIDVYEIDVAQDDELVVELSNLTADLDIVVWGRQAGGSVTALGPTSPDAPLFAITDPDGATSGAEPLDDFPRLDTVDPTLGVVAVSNTDGTAVETLQTGRLDAGTYYVQVYGANGATNLQPAALQLKVLEADERPACAAIDIDSFTGTPAVAATAADLAGADTLLLINERRLEQLHGPAARANVRAAADRLVAAAELDPSLGISPVVVPVDAYPSVRDAYDAWDSAGGSCDLAAANAVVSAINDAVIDPIRDQLTHVVILGPDELIPMARLADETQIANEYDYRHEFDGDLTGATANGRNALTSVFWESSILSDEPYGDAAARSLGNRFLYVTDIALGRVVETPAEIVDALDTYLAFNGTLDIDTASVLGYDFLADGSEKIADTLGETIPVVDRELALGPDPVDGWTADRATEKLREAATNALISLNAHFDHYRSLPAIGDKVPSFDDNLIAETVRGQLGADSLAQSLIFSMGCHSGLSVSDITIGSTNQDWAQNLGQMGSLFVGNTGFGYGDTETVAYTEELMALFAAQVTAPFETGNGSTTVGQALAWAKNEFVAGLQTFSVYDEKAVQESTFYGLPFYRVGLPTAPLPAPPTNVATPDATGTASLRSAIDATNAEAPTDRGVYYANTDAAGNEQVIVAPGRPIQPKAVTDVSVVDPTDPTKLDTIARGAIVLDMQSTYLSVPNPVIATPVFDEAFSQPEPTLNSGVFPTKPLEITTTTGPTGRRQQLVVATGQYRSDEAVQRLDDGLDIVVYYGDENDPDYTPPTIGAVASSISGGVLTVSLTAGSGADVDRVYLLVAENAGVGSGLVDWNGFDLTRTTSTNRWTGSLTLAPGTTEVEFIVHAKDQSGNVGYATNKARNFGSVVVPPPPAPPTPPPAQLTVVTPPMPTSGWFNGSATISVPVIAATGSPARYSINGVLQPTPLQAGDSFDITSDGVQNWSVISATGQQVSGTVRIDADGSPRVVLGTPRGDGNGTYLVGTGRVDAICRDTSLVRCDLAIDGTPVVNGQALPAVPGPYTLTYSAVDQLGGTTTGSAAFSIVAFAAAPVIDDLTIPTGTVPITTPVDLDATFRDASAPFDAHTATIDWGDGTESTATVVSPTTPGALGTITGSRAYDTTGRFTVTVTLVDDTNRSITRSAEVVVNDPVASPEIRSLVAPTVPQPISEAVQITATFIDGTVPDDTFTASIDWGDGTTSAGVVTPATLDSSGTVTGSRSYALPGPYTVVVTVTDSTGRSDEELAVVTVVAPTGAPQIVSVTGPTAPQTIATPVTIGATFLDASGSFDTYTATIDWGDGTTSPATVTAPTATSPGQITASRQYLETGVYSIGITVRDQSGASSSQPFEFVVLFDPTERGTVSGSGLYWSGPEARPGGSRWGTVALFGFDAKYKKGVVVGETELRLLGDFYFQSTQYDYLIVNDALAVAEGTGRIGSTTLRFRVQAVDNGRLDFVQLTIWNPTTNQVVYDNGVLFDKGDLVLLGGIKVKDK